MTRNEELVSLLEGVLHHAERISYMEIRRSGMDGPEIEAPHSAIVAAIRRRNTAQARQAVQRDILQDQINLFGQELGFSDFRHSLDEADLARE
jgi:DNA-binding GntR family transcriptional regulator